MTVKLVRIDEDECTAAMLRNFASVNYGLEMTGQEKKDTVIKRLEDVGFYGETIPMQVATIVKHPGPVTNRQQTYMRKEPMRDKDYNILREHDGSIRYHMVKDDDGNDTDEYVMREYAHILIPEEEKPGGDRAVPVGVNGSVMYIQRGVPSEVPIAYVRILQNATQMHYDNDEEQGLINARKVPNYPFQFLEPSPAHMDVEAA